MKKAACYIRVSTEEQVEYSPDSQLREMRAYAQRNQILIMEPYIFVDEGISGRSAGKRPAFQQMIALARQHPPFNVLLLYKFSRFARNREDSVVYKSLLRNKCHIEVISVTEPIDPENKMSGVMEAIIESMDEFYSKNLSEDVLRTMTEKAMRGQLQTVPPFGYCVQQNVLVPVPSEADVVREIYYRFLGGEGYLTIAKRLNERGILTHRGNPFENRTVAYILQNPVYKGWLRWTPKRIKKDCILAKGKHEPLICEDIWDAVQAQTNTLKLQYGSYYKQAGQTVHWLSGLLHCAQCGGVLCRSGNYFVCNRYAHGSCTQRQGILVREAEQLLLQQLATDMREWKPLPIGKIKNTESADIRSVLIRRIGLLTTKVERSQQAYLAGIDTLEEYRAKKTALSVEKEQAEEELRQLKQMRPKQQDAYRTDVSEILIDPNVSPEQKYSITHQLFYSITVDRPAGVFQLRYKLP